MSTATELRPRVASFAGFVLGALAGGMGFWAIGYRAIVLHPTSGGVIWNALLLASLLAFVFAIMSPVALVLYFGASHGGVRGDLVTVAGYVAAIAFVIAVAVVGVTVLEDVGLGSALDGIVLMDAIFGFTFGGIAGNALVRRWIRRRRARRA